MTNDSNKELEQRIRRLENTIRDLENENVQLHNEAHNVHALTKRLIKEVNIRIMNRANESKQTSHTLHYKDDIQLNIMLNDHVSPEKLLNYLKKADTSNIALENPIAARLRSTSRSIFWRGTHLGTRAGYSLAKNTYRLLRGR